MAHIADVAREVANGRSKEAPRCGPDPYRAEVSESGCRRDAFAARWTLHHAVHPIRKEVLSLCDTLSRDRPVFLPMTEISPDYGVGCCHNNVLDQVRRAGGRHVNGWMIWDARAYVEEGEFHSVWEDPEGHLVDLTPRVDGEDEMLFLPDAVNNITIDGTYDYFPNNRTSHPGMPFTHMGMAMTEAMSRRIITADISPFGFASLV